ncbi:tryptophan synthase subunit alpha [Garciella nitratireducens]|uniref:Tryptophan synthase alpha chain n=1 Tax=Garciella nitratireducens DSM 15102 TaxID=1121911 RepID=A0A1T4NXI7_9FIRM|nr:tryptophan synthase subunit alpha [Garciella nitratireducens]RBP46907.1 tryptophan synthase alpha chain [Garciella nitratireducens]SJZ84004.1 tryptophan synthase, alpha chain [Garciella nitratireducens DSM 15102]
MNRIDRKFNHLKEKNEKAFIAFITAGDPDAETTVDLVLAMEKAGADIIELGIPYSDPVADGVVIQESSIRALNRGIKIKDIMNVVKEIRKQSSIPLLYLVYYNCIFRYGIEKFLQECKQSGIDGLIIPDLPIEEKGEIAELAYKNGIDIIPMVAPTSEERVKKILQYGEGFVYCVSTEGVTGTRNEIATNLETYMNLINQYSKIPKALGFGVSDCAMAKEFSKYGDGVIVGSAIIKKIASSNSKEEVIEKVSNFVKELKEAIK